MSSTERMVSIPMTESFAKSMLALLGALITGLPMLAPEGSDVSQHIAGLEILRDTIKDAVNGPAESVD